MSQRLRTPSERWDLLYTCVHHNSGIIIASEEKIDTSTPFIHKPSTVPDLRIAYHTSCARNNADVPHNSWMLWKFTRTLPNAFVHVSFKRKDSMTAKIWLWYSCMVSWHRWRNEVSSPMRQIALEISEYMDQSLLKYWRCRKPSLHIQTKVDLVMLPFTDSALRKYFRPIK